MKNFLCLGLAVLAAISLSACNKKDQQYAGVDGDYVNGTPLSDRPDGAGSNFFGDNVQRGQFPPVYFGFDSTEIGGSEQSKIQQVADALKGGSKTIIVAGFTDDRGTEEYNRGLGERRADAVRQALINDGVAASRVQTVSFGQEMPADSGDNEAAWAKNRRAEFGVVK
jgi:peptidoglycan-associated lipoprotein